MNIEFNDGQVLYASQLNELVDEINLRESLENKEQTLTNSETNYPSSAAVMSQVTDLHGEIYNISTIGRFLSTWNAVTGLPATNPAKSPYTYKKGDYFIVGLGVVEGKMVTIDDIEYYPTTNCPGSGTMRMYAPRNLGSGGTARFCDKNVTPTVNTPFYEGPSIAGTAYYPTAVSDANYAIKPSGTSYTIGVASTDGIAAPVLVNDMFVYDGVSNWIHIDSASRNMVWGNISGDISNQTDLQNALYAAHRVTLVCYGTTGYDDVKSSYNAGKIIVAFTQNDGVRELYQLKEYDGTTFYFTNQYHENAGTLRLTSGGWTKEDVVVLATKSTTDTLTSSVTAIESKIPAQATSANQLADKDFVNSSIATNTATFRGTFNCTGSGDNVYLVDTISLNVFDEEKDICGSLLEYISSLSDSAYMTAKKSGDNINIYIYDHEGKSTLVHTFDGSGSSYVLGLITLHFTENTAETGGMAIYVTAADANNICNMMNFLDAISWNNGTYADADNNDYAFVVTKDGYGNTLYGRYKYTSSGSWDWEYDLNNSSFTAAQWAAINSGATTSAITSISSKLGTSDIESTITLASTNNKVAGAKAVVDYVASASSIEKGTGTNTIIQKGLSNQAVSENSIALGSENFAGLKGFYWNYVNLTDKTIYLSKTNDEILSTEPSVDTTFENPYAVGDTFSFHDEANYYNCGTISAIAHNKVTVSELPITEIVVDEEKKYYFYVFDKPNPTGATADFGTGAFAFGEGNKALHDAAFAEGAETIAYGRYAHTEGTNTKAAYSAHAEGYYTIASGESSHSEGNRATASGSQSHAEGNQTTASGVRSHAEGNRTVASGKFSHAEGDTTTASGERSHTEGRYTQTTNRSEHAEGEYNNSNHASNTYGNAGNTQHSIGIGTSDSTRKNAFEVMQNGDIYIYGRGGYDGTNAGASGVKSLQQLLADAGI